MTRMTLISPDDAAATSLAGDVKVRLSHTVEQARRELEAPDVGGLRLAAAHWGRQLIIGAVVVVVVLDAFQEFSYRKRRLGLHMFEWMSSVDRREQRRAHDSLIAGALGAALRGA